MTDWTTTYSSEFQVYKVDQNTWDDSEYVEGVQSLSLSRDATDDVPLLETASMEIEIPNPSEWSWYRIYMIAAQSGKEKIPIATLLFERGDSHREKSAPVYTFTGNSVLKPVADRIFDRGGYAPAGCDGAKFVADIIRKCLPISVSVETNGSFIISDDIVFDLDVKCLEVVWRVLDAANWCIRISGRGDILIGPKPDTPDLILDQAHASLLVPGIDKVLDLRGVPNKYIAVSDRERAVATNEDPNLLGSYQSRGRWIEYIDTSPILIDGEDLQAYAERKLEEMSTVVQEFRYTRDFWPDVVPFSLVRASLVNQGIEGDLRVLSHSCTFGKGIVFNETSGIEVRV